LSVSHRARRHHDRGGDPLDGLVNLFDLGIVLAVGFLIAALASLDLTELLTDQEAVSEAGTPITADPDDVVNEIEVQPGERVVGEGEEIGTVYRLEDGRTVIVRPENAGSVPGEGAPVIPEEPEAEVPTDPGAPESEVPPPASP
jgi:hypothetical protein